MGRHVHSQWPITFAPMRQSHCAYRPGPQSGMPGGMQIGP